MSLHPEFRQRRPIGLIPFRQLDGSIEFAAPDNLLRFSGEVSSEIAELILQATGQRSVGEIVDSSAIDPARSLSIISDLFRLGLLVDAAQQYEYFHETSKNPSRFHRPLTKSEIAAYTRSDRQPPKAGKTVRLPDVPQPPSVLARAARRSCRSFSAQPLELTKIAAVLRAAYDIRNRSVPSAGGLYPLRLFLLVSRAQVQVDSGYFEYVPEEDALVRFDDADEEQLKYCFNSETLPYGSAVQVLIAADLARQPGKYSNRGYRFTLLEAGIAAQSAIQAAAELGLQTCALGSFIDDAIAQELGFEPTTAALMAIAIGHEAHSATTAEDDYEHLAEHFLGESLPVHEVAASDLRHEDASFFGAYAKYRGNDVSTVSGGTSTSLAGAKTKALLEGVERYASGQVRFDVVASANTLGERRLLLPEAVAPLGDEQRARYGLGKFYPDMPVRWVSGESLAGEGPVLVPIDLVFYPLRDADHPALAKTNSSGVALFSNKKEAARRALLELVERDAVVRLWAAQVSPAHYRVIDIPLHERRRADFWARKGKAVHFLDISNDAVAVSLVVITSSEPPFLSIGAAANERSTQEAMRKSFREAEFALLSHSRDAKENDISYEDVRYVSDHARLHSDSRYASEVAWLHQGTHESEKAPSLNLSVNELHERYRSVLVDFKYPGDGYSVVRVLSTELVPIYFGLDSLPWNHPALGGFAPESRTVPHFFA